MLDFKTDSSFYMNLITCKYYTNDFHIFKEPKVLPCGETACLNCIKRELNSTCELKCPFKKCNSVHVIPNVNELVANSLIENSIDENLEYLTKNLVSNLMKQFSSLSG